MQNRKKRIALAILCGALTLAAIVCFALLAWLARLLPAQDEAARWRGESELAFSQISAYLPTDEKLSLSDVYDFRTGMVKKLREAALDGAEEERLWVDAWSTTGKAVVSTDLGRGDASVMAVGGEFFSFHPLQLLNGNYIAEGDFMKDRVLLDEELAWLLFGGTQLQGMEMKIDGVPFVVAGVIQREQDFASRKAYTAGMGLYMSYDAYAMLHEDAGISCYEFVMAEPVDGFALNFAREKFPIGDGELLQNTGRFAFGKLLAQVRQFGSRSMQTLGILYPYWENAARCVEDWGALLALLSIVFLAVPVVTVIVVAIRWIRRGKEKLDDDVLPELKDKTEEAIRVRQRRRWEKRHGLHER